MEQCKCKKLTESEIEQIKNGLPSVAETRQLSEFFKVFGDPSRLRILYYLARTELCVADLAALSGMQQPSVSQHLKTLRLSRLVKQRREGTIIYYSLDDEHVKEVYDLALVHIREQA